MHYATLIITFSQMGSCFAVGKRSITLNRKYFYLDFLNCRTKALCLNT